MPSKVTFSLICLVVGLLAVVFLPGCSILAGLATDAVTNQVAKDEPLLGIDTEIVAGDKEQSAKVGNTDTTTRVEEVELEDNAQFHNTTNTTGTKRETQVQSDKVEQINLNEGIPFWQAIIAAVGLLLVGLFTPQFIITRKRNN